MSDSDNEDYSFYGTPLEPIDEDNIPRKKPISVEDQIVTDQHGRRRFHGAFTGGFSAGFFNTVGSLEGWKPSSFKSSRSNKADSYVQKPEDFMDEEDRDEFGIAPTVLRAKPEYGGGAKGAKRPKPPLSEGPIPGEPVLKSILEPVSDDVGIRMLMRLGWKPGQGIGPRVTGEEKRRRWRKGQEAEGEEEDGEEENNPAAGVLFAPDEVSARLPTPKADTLGMGYKGLERRPVLSHVNLFEPTPLTLNHKANKMTIHGQAFGVGAFEEEDEDIYSKEDMSQYDFALETKASLAAKRREERGKKLLAITASSDDVLEGFVAEKGHSMRKKFFPPPELPPGFKPNPRKSRFEGGGAVLPTARPTIEDRAAAIGEPPITSKKTEKKVEEEESFKDCSSSNSSLFKPFENDPEKQGRYERYLKFVRIGAKDAFPKCQPSGMTDWEKERERAEFEKAAELYTPLTGFMAERFTPGSGGEAAQEAKETEAAAAAKMEMFGKLTRETSDWTPCALVCKRFNVPQPRSEESLSHTAGQKNKGRMKFSVFDFLEAAKKESLSSLQCPKEIKQEPEEEVDSAAMADEEVTGQTSDAEQSTSKKDIIDLDFEEPKDKMDLFKAIFLSGSENESEKEEDEKEAAVEVFPSVEAGGGGGVEEVLRNTSPPRGIFANLDLDSLIGRKGRAAEPGSGGGGKGEELGGGKGAEPFGGKGAEPSGGKGVEPSGGKGAELGSGEEDFFGPALPPPSSHPAPPPVHTVEDSPSSSGSESEWVEKEKDRERKHSKKHKKEKKKSRHKHKKKKKKRDK